MARKPTAAGPRGAGAPIEVADVRRAAVGLRSLLAIGDKRPDLLTQSGIATEVFDKARDAADDLERWTPPRMRDVAIAALAEGITREEGMLAWLRAQRTIQALTPFLVLVAAAKLDDENAPGSTRVLIELLKGTGLLAPAEAQDTSKRFEVTSLDEAEKEARRDPQAAKDRLLSHT